MNQQIPPDANAPGPKHSAKIAKILAKVDSKAKQLKSNGIGVQDHEKLKTRLTFAWCEDPNQEVTTVTTWRNAVARRAYSNVQDANNHLLLPVILAITPTECSTPIFKDVLPILLQHQQYTSYRLSLSLEAKKLLESMAEEGGFVANSRYLTLWQSLFPPEQEQPRRKQEAPLIPDSANRTAEIELMYSLVRIDDLPAFLQSLIPGVCSSEKIAREKRDGSETSNCATILIPLNVKDCICHFILDRDIAMKAISKYELSGLTTE